jgi:hypothetical protein
MQERQKSKCSKMIAAEIVKTKKGVTEKEERE